jgi:hypothetical protein
VEDRLNSKTRNDAVLAHANPQLVELVLSQLS